MTEHVQLGIGQRDIKTDTSTEKIYMLLRLCMITLLCSLSSTSSFPNPVSCVPNFASWELSLRLPRSNIRADILLSFHLQMSSVRELHQTMTYSGTLLIHRDEEKVLQKHKTLSVSLRPDLNKPDFLATLLSCHSFYRELYIYFMPCILNIGMKKNMFTLCIYINKLPDQTPAASPSTN